MKFSESDKGTYVSAKFTEATLDQIEKVQKSLGLLNPVSRDDLHTTICYSQVNVPFTASNASLIVSTKNHLEIWDTNNGPALILCLNSQYLEERHKYSRILGATYDYPDYKPHITLSYNLGAQAIDLSITDVNVPITISHEVVEDLDLDWTKDKI
jgi:hypothetical protein